MPLDWVATMAERGDKVDLGAVWERLGSLHQDSVNAAENRKIINDKLDRISAELSNVAVISETVKRFNDQLTVQFGQHEKLAQRVGKLESAFALHMMERKYNFRMLHFAWIAVVAFVGLFSPTIGKKLHALANGLWSVPTE